MTQIIDGKKLAQEMRTTLREDVLKLKQQGITPGIAVVLVGEHPASQVYVKNKCKACEEIGIESFPHRLPATTTEIDLLALIEELNHDPDVHGILVQLPLPSQISEMKVMREIAPHKDVDGFHPMNVGALALGQEGFIPCTPEGVVALLDAISFPIEGKHAVVIGKSNIVGKPVAVLLLQRSATVTICHSKTQNLQKHIAEADILVVAIGKPQFIQGSWIKKGAVVIDVGINRLSDGMLTGDVDFESAKTKASAITPVPGGVGPMTIAMLLKNVVKAARHQQKETR